MNMKWSVVRTLLLPFLMALVFAHPAFAASTREIDWHERDAYAGWVTDAATGEPIEGVVVVAVWRVRQHAFTSVSKSAPDIRLVRLEETLSDKRGYFEFAPLRLDKSLSGWSRDEIAFPLIQFFKPGYTPEAHTIGTWEFGAETLNEAEKTPRKKMEWMREVRLYKYSTRPKPTLAVDPSIMRTDEGDIVARLMGFARFLDRNVSIASESGDASSAIAAQRRAISMIDAEITKYRPGRAWAVDADLINAIEAERTAKRP